MPRDSRSLKSEPVTRPFPSLHELDCVTVSEDIAFEERLIRKGSRGTIVDWVDGARFCEVEFVEPFPCVATIDKQKLEKSDGRSLHSAR
jgi:hypothetical protein